jgi:hypothetical protein
MQQHSSPCSHPHLLQVAVLCLHRPALLIQELGRDHDVRRAAQPLQVLAGGKGLEA